MKTNISELMNIIADEEKKFTNITSHIEEMIFNETITKEQLKHKEIGQGYIYLDGNIKDFKAFNIVLDRGSLIQD